MHQPGHLWQDALWKGHRIKIIYRTVPAATLTSVLRFREMEDDNTCNGDDGGNGFGAEDSQWTFQAVDNQNSTIAGGSLSAISFRKAGICRF